MIIVWRGWGLLVLLFGFVAIAGGTALVEATHLQAPYAGMVLGSAAVFAGAGVWLFASWMDAQPGRVFIDKESGREFTVGRDAGSLFFVPTKYWAFILPGGWMVYQVVTMVWPGAAL